jgi:hypothetical protein
MIQTGTERDKWELQGVGATVARQAIEIAISRCVCARGCCRLPCACVMFLLLFIYVF